jgi:hypothetical protein
MTCETAEALPASPERMRNVRTEASNRSDRGERIVLWVLLLLGLFLMLAAGAAAEPAATRIDRFSGALRPGGAVRVDNVSGDILASPGRGFSAVVTVTVNAPTRERAEEILQKTRVIGTLENNEYRLVARWPDARLGWGGRSRRSGPRCNDCKVHARIELSIPPAVTAELKTVNGEVRVRELDGDLALEAVNGGISAQGFRGSLSAQTVNGRIEAVARRLEPQSAIELETVNGGVVLTLPKESRFDLTASTMNGALRSTFPLPPGPGGDEPLAERGKEKEKRRLVVQGDGDVTTVIDLQELEKRLESSMRDVDLERVVREAERAAGRVRLLTAQRSYRYRLGAGPRVRLESLNGNILLLASGSSEAQAKPIVAERRSIVVTVPRIELRIPKPVVRIAPHPDPDPDLDVDLDFDSDEVVRGDVPGDFLSTSGGGSYRVGRVGGRVRILTHSGEIEVAGAGAGADLKTHGGDIKIGPVRGDLRARTLAGDIKVAGVTGSASLDTSGGDIQVDHVGGRLEARTAGGEIVALAVGGGVVAETAGGDVRIALAGREAKGGAVIKSAGGDVVLTLPAEFRGNLDLTVFGAGDWAQRPIRCDFPGITLSRQAGAARGTGALNGGGEKVVVQTSSGEIRVRKAEK